ncbi:hypothetical protein [Ulvibacter litoralis]|uniref:Pre-peptidase C-terminal domain-containing protein n=1 Tax=Ulvibacter litoralis TaxID=227084 RepID=A0A1G7I416_9FLAO|nr:hypothetical protein [Ulvibacter litoralis]GHC62586.1 hypothetical protein GCM10008083_29700 [Ulvibacter litoralis]SDF07353.1 hypothetical protein SAMN05421855_10581 [Ulvibacter litoralis]
MKLKTKITLLFACFALSIFVSCTQDQAADLTVETTTDISIEDAAKKLDMLRARPTVQSKAAITYLSELCGDVVSGTSSLNSYDDASLWGFYSFEGTAGDAVDISVLRTNPGMDVGMTLYFGTTTTSDGLDAFGPSTNPDMTYLNNWDDNIPNPSCFSDPGVSGYVLPNTGVYTLVVYDVLGCGDPYTYEIHTSGISCFIDTDGDGCEDEVDPHPNSNEEATVTIDGCDSGAPNMYVEPCSTMSDLIADCAANAANHAEFVACVKALATAWRRAGHIDGRQNYYLQRCASSSSLP